MASKNSYSSWTVSLHQFGAGPAAGELWLRRLQRHRVADPHLLGPGQRHPGAGELPGRRGATPSAPSSMRSVFGISSIRFTVNGQAASSGSGTTSSSGGGLTANGSTSLDSQGTYTVISGSGSLSQAGLDGLYAISGSGSITPAEDAALRRRLRHGHPHRHPGDGERQLLLLPGLRQRPPAGSEPVRGLGHGGAGLHL